MGAPYRNEDASTEPTEGHVRQAVRTWGRSVLGGPRRLDEQITGIEECNEIVVRAATEIVRRDLVERRSAAHARAHPAGKALRSAKIDPFAGTMADLRTQTEHAARCANCEGSGLVGCPGCNASGRANCSGCGGSGRTYARSTRGAKCKECRETGKVHCARCDGTAKVTCDGCGGSGQQLVWWEYAETARVVASFLSDSPILKAHRHLCEHRFLAPRDLVHFTPFVTVQRSGPIPQDALDEDDAEALTHVAPAVDPRLERVQAQQFLRFGVVRRDVRYEMCGGIGTVALSGAALLGANTPEALRPIHRRLAILAGATLLLIVLASLWYSKFHGPTAYFAASNSGMLVMLIAGMAGAITSVSGALRRLRPARRWWPSGRFELAYTGVFLAAFASVPFIGFVCRPSVSEARTAIAGGDLEKAHVLVEALGAAQASPDVVEVGDELTIAEAERLSGDARIARLDEAAGHPGPKAEQARDRARTARIELVQAVLAARHPAEALTRLDNWAAALTNAPEAIELRAQAHDQMITSCSDEACRFIEARLADSSHPTPARSQALSAARQQLLAALQPPVVANLDVLARVRALRSAAVVGNVILAATPDVELSEKANAAILSVGDELSKIHLLGAPLAVVNDILDRSQKDLPLTGWRELEGVAVHAADVAGRCSGLYVVGATKGGRALTGKEPGLRRLLAQATGRPTAAIQPRPRSTKEQEISRWMEGSTQVLARWNGESLMELRIGDATP